MEKYITDENTGLKYELIGDYYFLAGDDEPEEEIHIGVWGHQHYQYLRNNKPFIARSMRMNGKLLEYLKSVDDTAQSMYENLISKLSKQEGVTEKMKAEDQMAYVCAMNSIANRAREIVLTEVIYK